MGWYRQSFAPYVSVGDKKAKGINAALALAKRQKRIPQPVQPKGRLIATNFWGKAWCEHLKTMHDLENRLDRGKRYLANGSVVDLMIRPGKVEAIVAGSSPYSVTIKVEKLANELWEQIKKRARNSVRSVVDLLAGKLDEQVIRHLTDSNTGIFPKTKEIHFNCSCPDGAYVCKHVAAVFYGVGTLLDSKPELLFLIRDVDSTELVGLEAVASSLEESLKANSTLKGSDLEEMFGIVMEKESGEESLQSKKATKPKQAKPAALAPKPEKPASKPKQAKPAATKPKPELSKDGPKSKKPLKSPSPAANTKPIVAQSAVLSSEKPKLKAFRGKRQVILIKVDGVATAKLKRVPAGLVPPIKSPKKKPNLTDGKPGTRRPEAG